MLITHNGYFKFTQNGKSRNGTRLWLACSEKPVTRSSCGATATMKVSYVPSSEPGKEPEARYELVRISSAEVNACITYCSADIKCCFHQAMHVLTFVMVSLDMFLM